MAEVTVFVDDAVLGRLPNVCAKDGVASTGRLRVIEEVGRSNRLGILWLLLFAGPLGVLVLLFLTSRDSGEHLAVELPFSDAAYSRLVAARRLRNGLVALAVIGGGGMLLLSIWAQLGAPGAVLTVGIVAVAIVGLLVAEFRSEATRVGVSLDASRRWVTLSDVHPAFVGACQAMAAPAGRI